MLNKIKKKRFKLNKSNFFIVLISSLCLTVATVFNACAPLETADLASQRGIGNPFDNGGSDGSGPVTAGKTFFTNNIEPIVRSSSCVGCHGSPREITVPLSQAGPILYEKYNSLRLDMLSGSSGTNNPIYNRLTAVTSHPGGNRCSVSGAAGTPCKEFLEWYQIESSVGSAVPGLVSKITPLGDVEGWAVEFTDQTKSIEVRFYDGPNNAGGTLLGSVQANRTGPAGGFSGNHVFSFQLPSTMKNGQQHQLYVYGVDSSGNEVELGGSPYTAVAYEPSQAMINFFNNTVRGSLNARCAGCHNFNAFDDAFERLLSPTPFEGGTRSNNRMYNYGNGLVTHAGGNACGGNCSLQQWYDML